MDEAKRFFRLHYRCRFRPPRELLRELTPDASAQADRQILETPGSLPAP